MEDYIIRDYRESDYQALIRLWEKTGLGSANRGDDALVISKTLQHGGKLLLIERSSDSSIIGSSWLTNDSRRLYLHHFGISPGCQGQGLAKPLLKASVDWARSQKMQLKIEVHRENKVAINLYTKAGFSYLGDYDVYIIRKFD